MKRISMMLVVAALLGLATLGAQDLDVELQRLGLAVGTVKRYLSDGIARLEELVGDDAGHRAEPSGMTAPVVAARQGRR